MSCVTTVTLPGKTTALECPHSAPCCSIQRDSMAGWEHIRPRPVVGCLPFWGELFLAWYHMPEDGMCLLRKDKFLFFMFGKLLLACQRGLYLVLVLFSQQAGKIVMMIQLEIYQGSFPRVEEDLVEVSFEFPALNLAASIFSGYSTSCSQAQACGVAVWTEIIHSWHWWNSYQAGYSDIQLGTQNSALLVVLNPGCSCCSSCSPSGMCCPGCLKETWSRCAESRDPESSSSCSQQNPLCLSSACGLPTIQKAHGTEGNMSPDTHCKNFTSSVPFPCETATSRTS